MKPLLHLLSLVIFCLSAFAPVNSVAQAEVSKVVVQLTRDNENFGHRKTFFQIDKVLSEIGEDKLEIVVVAYEDGINALTNNADTAQMLTKLVSRGVVFKACRISMKAWDLTEDNFPLEVEFVPAGAPEVIRRQIAGYNYWRP